ncbi:hypothetical protein NMY22_g15297 [Coprinellus aureogranulatus]|nr:hypothetical protein NMY22_g15297 [Coprinellus aureogranulatus]
MKPYASAAPIYSTSSARIPYPSPFPDRHHQPSPRKALAISAFANEAEANASLHVHPSQIPHIHGPSPFLYHLDCGRGHGKEVKANDEVEAVAYLHPSPSPYSHPYQHPVASPSPAPRLCHGPWAKAGGSAHVARLFGEGAHVHSPRHG